MRSAYVIASNGPRSFGSIEPLTFALQDASRLRALLSSPRCGFEVLAPASGAASRDVTYGLEALCEKCGPDDAVVCYFSGHGILDSNGDLILLWDHSRPDQLITSAISAARLMEALKRCRAKNRLLLLDCCHAGAVVHMAGLKGAGETPLSTALIPPDNYAILMASGRTEKARELAHLEGSFFTDAICAALAADLVSADHDKDGRVSVADLTSWLQDQAARHNRKFPADPVPYPSAFGKYRGDFYLTVGVEDWVPVELPWPDGSTMVVLPVKDREHPELAVCMGKHPVTNRQFRQFLEQPGGTKVRRSNEAHFHRRFDASLHERFYRGGARNDPEGAPHGEDYARGNDGVSGAWKGPFEPWSDVRFSADDQPVVCVDLDTAEAYARWVSTLHDRKAAVTGLPAVRAWDFAAFGTAFPPRDPRLWLRQGVGMHLAKPGPAPVDRTGERTNRWGVSDMIGNIWEWCIVESNRGYAMIGPPPASHAVLRGGSYLDDLMRAEPFLDVAALPSQHLTSHSDLGFRVSAVVLVDSLAPVVQHRLSTAETIDQLIYEGPNFVRTNRY